MIIATFVIVISFIVFFYLFANIFIPLAFDIPATIKLGKRKIINQQPVLKKYILTITFSAIVASLVLSLSYYFFVRYSLGFSISIFIGAGLALLLSLWKMLWLLPPRSDNYLKWLDFYIKDNSSFLETSDTRIIDEVLSGKPEKLGKATNKLD